MTPDTHEQLLKKAMENIIAKEQAFLFGTGLFGTSPTEIQLPSLSPRRHPIHRAVRRVARDWWRR